MAIIGRAGLRSRFLRSLRKDVIGTFTALSMRLAFHSLWVRTSRINGTASPPNSACNSFGEISGTLPKGIHQNLLRQRMAKPRSPNEQKSAVSLYDRARLSAKRTQAAVTTAVVRRKARGGPQILQGDPCALAEILRAGGIDLVIHTVGLGVGDDAQRQLQCIAEKGGGNYYHADSSEALRKALYAVRDATAKQEPPPPPPAAPKLPEAKAGGSKRIAIAGPGTIVLKPAPWVKMPPYRWSVADAETGDQKGQSTSDRLRVKICRVPVSKRQSSILPTLSSL